MASAWGKSWGTSWGYSWGRMRSSVIGGGIVSKPRKPQRARYEVNSFTNFIPQPIIQKDDNDLIILMMMQGG